MISACAVHSERIRLGPKRSSWAYGREWPLPSTLNEARRKEYGLRRGAGSGVEMSGTLVSVGFPLPS